METARDLQDEGVEVVYLPVSKNGIADLKKLKKSLSENTVLVSVMYANNEIGTIQPIREISKIISEFRNKKEYPLFHTDAVQAFQFLDCDVRNLGVDLITMSAHKIYGPKGIGALYVGSRVQGIGYSEKQKKFINPKPYTLTPIITGGGQEFGMRSGTENVPLVVGFAKAVSLVSNFRQRRTGALARRSHWRRRELENKRISKLRDYFWKELKKIYPAAKRNGDPKNVLSNFLNVYFPDYESADLLVGFDLAGLAVSAGSACSARSAQPSYVMKALDFNEKQSRRNIRFTLGRPTSKKDIDKALKIIKNVIT